MKKYVSIIVCAILIGLSIFLSVDTEKVSYGAGNGVNAKINSVDEVADVLQSFVNGGTTLTSLTSNNEEDDNSKKYTSATFVFETSAKVGISQSSSKSSSSANIKLDKTMTCYFTETSSYYIIDAVIRNSSSSWYDTESSSSSSNIKMKMELYMSDETIYIRFKEFTLATRTTYKETNSKINNFKPILNKWFDFTGFSEGDSILEVNEDNYKIMSTIGKYVRNYKEEGFTKSGGVYNLKEDNVVKLCNEIFKIVGGSSLGDELDDKYFTLNMSNVENPIMELFYAYDNEESGQGLSYSVNCAEKTKMSIKNINNTVAEFPEDVELHDPNEVEF